MAILSIQSHVSYGHAGNSSAVFPLQRLGHQVWPVYTVLFSNHTGYGQWRGSILAADVISDVVKGIFERQDYKQCDVLMTGYMGSTEIADVVIETVETIRKNNPDFIYSCDPVMGDFGRGFYTPANVQSQFKSRLLNHFDILCPNHFELEYLTDSTIQSVDHGFEMARSLISREDQIVIVTSLMLSEEEGVNTLLVTKNDNYVINTPLIPLNRGFAGSGDLFHALFMGHYLTDRDLKLALKHAVNAIYDILLATEKSQSQELQIIPNQQFIISPFSNYG